jgi:hypothetical protein
VEGEDLQEVAAKVVMVIAEAVALAKVAEVTKEVIAKAEAATKVALLAVAERVALLVDMVGRAKNDKLKNNDDGYI